MRLTTALPVCFALLAAPGCAALREPRPGPQEVAAVPEEPPPEPTGPERTTGSAGRLLVYSAITGHVPMQKRSPAGLSDAGREAVRAAELEAEIEQEMQRQEDLSGREPPEKPRAPAPAAAAPPPPPPPPPAAATASVDPARIAPKAPEDRDLPELLFKEERVKVPPGTWGNAEELVVVRRELDVDEDGRPEQVRYLDPRSRLMLRKEEDLDFDGRMDVWSRYQDGELAERVLDSSHDGRSDVWERYAGGVMTERALDRDDDGVRDAVFRYEGAALVEERHDADNDGREDLVIYYENLRRTRAEEDRNLDGRIDTWTTFQTVDGRDHPARIEQDLSGRGTPDVVEMYQVKSGEAQLARREEDTDGDGKPDVVSIYENGKLVAREISNPELTPL